MATPPAIPGPSSSATTSSSEPPPTMPATTTAVTAAMGVTPGSSALAHIPLITAHPTTTPTPLPLPVTATPPPPATSVPPPPAAAMPLPPATAMPAAPIMATTSSTPIGSSMPPAISAATASDPSLFAADGICPLPEQLRKKILNLEYVDMAELRPESWLFHSDTDSATPLQGLFQRRKEPVTDLAVWMQCYASLTSVLVEKYPQYTKHFLAYMATIATGYKRFKGLCWAAYDAAYRRKAARTKSLLWGNVDQYLYTVWFTNQAQGPSCTNCLSCEHTMDTCPNLPIPLLGQLLPSQQQMQISWNQPQQRLGPMHTKQAQEPCGLYNAAGGPRCAFNPCKYSHTCKSCGGGHPASSCPRLSRKRQQNPNWQPQKFMKPFPN